MESSCMSKIFPGSEVIAYWHIDQCWKRATVISRYGELSHSYADGSESGIYQDLVTLRFHDGSPDYDSQGHFTDGVVLVDCYLNNCPDCRGRHVKKAWDAVRQVAEGRIARYSHKDMCKLLRKD